ncbi:YceI family protein [Amycolatopsis sp. cmx-4-61]|uniref:YceI family protein n=1 Tax=Amycolatopsis sp. cmx-4-61 TaxID=2790937 RepID=UPI00397C844E
MSPHTVPALRAGTWTVRSGRTTASFGIRNFGVNRVRGTIPVRTGAVEVRDGAVTAVRAVLDLRGLDTRHERRDADLRKPKLLDSGARPEMTFAADDVRRRDTGWEVPGELRLRGTSCPLTLLVEPVTGTRVRATARLDRAPLGIRAPRLLVGRYVWIVVEAEFEPPC